MQIGIAALTDTQRVVLESGKALAEQLGLHEYAPTKKVQHHHLPDAEKALFEELGVTLDLTESGDVEYSVDVVEFEDGQTAVMATPNGTNAGVIRVEVREYLNKQRFTEYTLNDEILYKKSERFKDGEWVTLFNADLRIPANSTLYVS